MTVPGVYSPEQGAKKQRRQVMVRQARIVAVMALLSGFSVAFFWVVQNWPTQLGVAVWAILGGWALYATARSMVDIRDRRS